jgi:uncharacterized membrane protein YeaQ/YmgE (transglycosylase-associated protein family)
MSFIVWIFLGLISGFVSHKVDDGSRQGLLRDIALGVLGAFAGGLMFHLIGQTGVTGINIWSIFVSVLGAGAVLFGYHAIVGRSSQA